LKRSKSPMLVTSAVILFFYIPLFILILNSFNDTRFSGPWKGFTLKWYAALFREPKVWYALGNSLMIAGVATVVSMLGGTMAAFALHRYNSRMQTFHHILLYAPIVIPDILMGISLLLLFVAIPVQLGLSTIITGHITFCLSYTTMVILGRLQDFDFGLVEAAMDLGAGWWKAIIMILIPYLMPGILAGGLLAFTLSIDDFVVTFFVTGTASTTLPLYIYSMIKHGSPPIINALSVIMVFFTFITIMIVNRLLRRNHE